MTTWFVVAHRAGARMLEREGNTLRLVSDIPHEAGRLKSGEIDSDRAGRSFDKGGGQGRHGLSTEETAHDHVALTFARHLAEVLLGARNNHLYTRLVLVAEPKFLGMIKGALDHATAAMIGGTVTKDLAHVGIADLQSHLKAAW